MHYFNCIYMFWSNNLKNPLVIVSCIYTYIIIIMYAENEQDVLSRFAVKLPFISISYRQRLSKITTATFDL